MDGRRLRALGRNRGAALRRLFQAAVLAFTSTLLSPISRSQTAVTTPTVATCAAAASGTSFGTAWLPCTAPVAFLPVSQVAPSTIVADLRCAAGAACQGQWLLASAVQSGDQVWEITATALTGGWVAANTIPLPPASTVAVTGTVTFTWASATTNVDGSPLTDLTGVNLYRGTSCVSLSKVGTAAVPTIMYSDTGLASGSYCYALTSVSASEGEGPQSGAITVALSNPVSTSKPSPPGNPTAACVVTAPVGTKVTCTVTPSP
jgi:hypothetical protein